MKRIISLLCVFTLCFSIVGCSNEQTANDIEPQKVASQKENVMSDEELSPIGLTQEQKIEDYNFFWDTMNELYPYWGELKDQGVDKEAIYEKYLELIKSSKNDCEFLNLMFKCISGELGRFSYGHLSFFTTQTYYWTLDNFKMISRHKAWKDALYNPVSRKNYKLFDFDIENMKGFVPNNKDDNKQKKDKIDSSINSPKKFYTDIINDKKTAYICIPSFDGLLMENQVPQVKNFINENNNISDLIIDIRGNGGGNSNYWVESIVSLNIDKDKTCCMYYLYNDNLFTNELSKPYLEQKKPRRFPINELPKFDNLSKYATNYKYFTSDRSQIPAIPSETPFIGKIWVLGDRGNYSAASEFLDFCKQSKFATIVGESSGGDNPYTEPSIFVLPNSGFMFWFDLYYGLNSDGSCNAVSGTKPDIECSSKDALDVCLKEINKAN